MVGQVRSGQVTFYMFSHGFILDYSNPLHREVDRKGQNHETVVISLFQF